MRTRSTSVLLFFLVTACEEEDLGLDASQVDASDAFPDATITDAVVDAGEPDSSRAGAPRRGPLRTRVRDL